MAGDGSRFLAKGFEQPKPLILFNGEPLFVNSIKSFTSNNSIKSLTFAVQRKHEESFQISDKIRQWYPEAKILVLDSSTSGAAETAYLCIKNGNFGAERVVVLDADQSFELTKIPDKAKEFSFFIGTFPSNNPAYSYVEAEESLIKRIVEKEVISRTAVAGIYGFNSANIFLEVYEKTTNWPEAHERYMSSLITLLLNEGAKGFEVSLTSHTPLGTPEELEKAIRERVKT